MHRIQNPVQTTPHLTPTSLKPIADKGFPIHGVLIIVQKKLVVNW
jgi:hypothetical protein